MPNYTFRCGTCAAEYEINLSIHDKVPEALTCTCTGTMSRVYSTFGLILKGTGWGKSK